MTAVAEVCMTVAAEKKRRGLKGPQVLQLVHERSYTGQPDVSKSLEESKVPTRVREASSPYFSRQ